MRLQVPRSSSQGYFWPVIWAVSLHVLLFGLLFVSFAFTPELPASKPIVQATLYQLKSQSQATVQTNQKIAGEAKRTAARQYEIEQLEQKKVEQQKQVAAKAAERKRAEAAQKAAAAKAAEREKAAQAKKAEAAAKAAEAEQRRQADVAKKKAAEEAAKKQAETEAAKKKAAEEEARKQAAAEAGKKKAAEEARKQASAEAAKKKAAAEAARKAAEDKKAKALAELLSDTTERRQALAETQGAQVAGSLDDLIVSLVSQQWRRPPSARNGMSVEVTIRMLPDGTIANASVTRSSGDSAFDSSAVAAVRNVSRIPEMQQLDRATFDRMYRQRRMVFKPEDLEL